MTKENIDLNKVAKDLENTVSVAIPVPEKVDYSETVFFELRETDTGIMVTGLVCMDAEALRLSAISKGNDTDLLNLLFFWVDGRTFDFEVAIALEQDNLADKLADYILKDLNLQEEIDYWVGEVKSAQDSLDQYLADFEEFKDSMFNYWESLPNYDFYNPYTLYLRDDYTVDLDMDAVPKEIRDQDAFENMIFRESDYGRYN